MKKLIAIAVLLLACVSAFGQGQISGISNFGCSGAAVTGTAITSGTANNTVVFTGSNFAAWGYSVQLTQTSTVTAGAVSFKSSNDGGSTFTAVPVAQVLNTSTFAQLTNPYTLVASTNQSFLILMNGASNFEVQLTTAMTGSGTITPSITAVCTAPPALVLDASGNLKVNINAQSLAKVLVTPDSVALPANQSTNVNQLAGTTTDTNSGNKSAGTLRVVLATDQPQPTNKFLVTPDSVALPANQSVNVAQMNGVATTMGNGTSGTGVQRIAIASDNTVLPGVGAGATGAAPPANAVLEGGLGSGATGGFLIGKAVGDTPKAINISTATTTLIVTGVSGRQVRITSVELLTAAANNVAWIEGTGATCGTGTAGMAGGTTAASGYNFAANSGMTHGTGVGTILQTATTGDSVCLVTSAATQLSGAIQYTIY